MYKPKILALAGSLRKESFNKKMLSIAVNGAKKAGGEVTVIDLKDYTIPLYDQDIEDSSGIPQDAQKIKDLMINHDGFLIACPEYNSSIPGVFKNVIDWASRKSNPKEINLVCFNNKVVSLMSASIGSLAGLRGLAHLRNVLENINCLVLPLQKGIPFADKVFLPDKDLENIKLKEEIEEVGANLTRFLIKLSGHP